MAKNPETIIQDTIQDYLNKRKIMNIRMNASGAMAGMPDILCVYRGYAVALEIKTLTGKRTELQERIIDQFRVSGGVGGFVTSIFDVDILLDEVDEKLDGNKFILC